MLTVFKALLKQHLHTQADPQKGLSCRRLFSFPRHPPLHIFQRLFNLSSYTRFVLRAWNELSVQEWAPLEGTFFQGTLTANPTQALDSSTFPSGSNNAKPASQTLGSAKTWSLCNVRPGVLGDIHQQTVWSLWNTPAHTHLPTAQPYLTLWNSMDCSLPGFSAHGILQVRTLQWVAILFPGDLPNPGVALVSPALHADSLPSELPGKPPVSKKKPWVHCLNVLLCQYYPHRLYFVFTLIKTFTHIYLFKGWQKSIPNCQKK